MKHLALALITLAFIAVASTQVVNHSSSTGAFRGLFSGREAQPPSALSIIEQGKVLKITEGLWEHGPIMDHDLNVTGPALKIWVIYDAAYYVCSVLIEPDRPLHADYIMSPRVAACSFRG